MQRILCNFLYFRSITQQSNHSYASLSSDTSIRFSSFSHSGRSSLLSFVQSEMHGMCSVYNHLSHLLQECAISGDLRSGKSVHCKLLKLNFSGFVSLWNQLLNLCVFQGGFPMACHLFDKMPQRDVVTYNTMISANVRLGNSHRAVDLYSMMKDESIYPNHITLASLIRLGCTLHAQITRYGLGCDRFVGSSLVEMYAKERRLSDAIRAFSEIAELDLVSWNIMIDGCAISLSKKQALRFFTQMIRENVGFDAFTLTSVLKTLSVPKDLNWGKLLHGIATKAGLVFETPMNNALITMYSKCEEGMLSAINIFPEIVAPNIISWTAMVTGLMHNGQNDRAIRFYRKLLGSCVKENHFTFASILPAYGNLSNLEQGRAMHGRIVKSPFNADVSVNNALIDMYSKCGSLSDSLLVFSLMKIRDIVSYSTIITCFGHHGKGREALVILQNMMNGGLIPDDVTFLGCLSACSHSGLIDEGIQIFRIMVGVYSHKPKKEHFSCVVDLLGRAGRLNEAEAFIEDMGVKSDVTVWETLLGACKIHGEMSLGEKVTRRIVELQPEKHEPYVLLANLYAESDLWEDKEVVRERLGGEGLKAEVGRSWVA